MKFLERSFFQRLLGQCATPEPADSGCWSYSGGQVQIDLARAPELVPPSGAVRLEGRGLPERLLVVHGEDGRYRAMSNRCTHFGRRLDPVPGTGTVQCCSINKSTFDDEGRAVYGPAKRPVRTFDATTANNRLFIPLE